MSYRIKTEKTDKTKQWFRGWQVLREYLMRYKSEVVVLSFIGVVSALANGSVPYLIGQFFDALILPSHIFSSTDASMPRWLFFLLIFAAVQFIANFVDWESDKKSRRIGTFIHADYPRRAISTLLRLPMSFHKGEKTGVIWDRIIRAGNAVATIIEQVVINITPQLLSVLVGLVIAFFIQPILALVLVGGLALYIATLVKIVPPIVEYQRKGNKAWNKAYGNAYDALANTQTIKQSTAEGYEDRKMYRQYILGAAALWYKVEKIWSGVSFYQRLIVTVTQIIIFSTAVYYITNDSLTIGSLIAFNGYASMVFGPFVRLGHNWQIIQSGLVALDRAQDILNTLPENHYKESLKVPKGINGNISFDNVHFSYKKRNADILNGVNFSVKQGEVVALVGESGGGKSTLVDLISGYYFPTSGKILIDGMDIHHVDLKYLRERIAVVPQEVVLFNDTIKTNIMYGNFSATDKEIMAAAEKAHANVFIDKFPKKYNQAVGERGVKLSVGQKQRIAIARAILRNPRILILDEPTSALDPQTERFITESLEELMKGRTTFIIAHRLSTVRKANRIFVLNSGKIVESGSHDELMKIDGGVYQKIYNMHIGLT